MSITRRSLRRIPSQKGTYDTYVERPDPDDEDGDYIEIPVRIAYTFHPGHPDTWDEPGQPDHCEIDVLQPAGFELTADEEARIEHEIIGSL